MNNYIPLVVAAVLLAGGCGKKEEARPVAPQPSLMNPGDSSPVALTPPLPAPNVPKGAEAPSPHLELPHPGQAGASRTRRINARSGNVIGNQNNQEVMTMMQGEWMGSWGTGSMGGWGGLWMILVVILVIVGIVAVMTKK